MMRHGHKNRYAKFKNAGLWLGLLAADTAAQLCLKEGAVQIAAGHALSPRLFAGYGFIVVAFLFWMQILKSTRLSIALSATSLLYVTVALAAHFVLHETLTPLLLVGCLLIGAGVFVIGGKSA